MTATAEVVKPRGGGRPRSEATRRTILTAALQLLKTESIQSITIEAIAREAEVSKATIYRWWSSKGSVVIDAFLDNHILKTPMRHDVHPAEALLAHWRSLAEQYSGWAGTIVRQILAEGQSDPSILREFRERFHYGRRAVVREVTHRLQETLNRDPRVDAEVLMDMLYSSIYMRLLWQHLPLDRQFVQEFPISCFRLIGIEFDEDGKVIE